MADDPDINDLLPIYEKLLDDARRLPPEFVAQMGTPYLPWPRENWAEAKHRVLIVGQEPKDWGFPSDELPRSSPKWPYPEMWNLGDALQCDQSVEALTYAYRKTTYEPSKPTGKPYDGAVREIQSIVEGQQGEWVTTNLFPCTFATGSPAKSIRAVDASPADRNAILDWQRGFLTSQIRVLCPTAVLLFTGPVREYNEAIEYEFEGVKFINVDERPSGEFARIVHPTLPQRSYRTFHPRQLRQLGWWGWVQELADFAIAA